MGYVDVSPRKKYYPANEDVTLTAKPESIYSFVKWKGSGNDKNGYPIDGQASPTIQIRMNKDRSVKGVFRRGIIGTGTPVPAPGTFADCGPPQQNPLKEWPDACGNKLAVYCTGEYEFKYVPRIGSAQRFGCCFYRGGQNRLFYSLTDNGMHFRHAWHHNFEPGVDQGAPGVRDWTWYEIDCITEIIPYPLCLQAPEGTPLSGYNDDPAHPEGDYSQCEICGGQ